MQPHDPSHDPFRSPQAQLTEPSVGQGDSTGGVIPYKNLPALIAYYLGVFSILPCIGLLLAPPALVLGIMGLIKRNKQPEIKGSVHAWIGIVMGGLFTLVWGGLAVLALVGTFASRY